jgi:AcrR family transcriptional regulator
MVDRKSSEGDETAGTARRHRDPARRAELLSVAARCFAERAFDEVFMDDIAAEAGVAKGLLFYYFGSKRKCYLAVIEGFHQQLLEDAYAHMDVPASQLISRMLDRYLDFAEGAEPAYRLIMSGGLGADREACALVADQRSRYRALFTELAYPGRSESPALRVAFEGFLSFMEGATLDWLNHREISREALHTLILAIAPAVQAAAVVADPTLASAGATTDRTATGASAGHPVRRRGRRTG